MDENGYTASSTQAIASVFIRYFTNLFTSSTPTAHLFTFNFDSTIPELPPNNYLHDLTNPPSMQELKNIVDSMSSDKSPGPDGLNATFYKSAWSIIGKYIDSFSHKFYTSGKFPSTINQTHIVLIPKKTHTSCAVDFRPISLYNVLYKIITKSLALRMKNYMPSLLDNMQNAFVPGREIFENILIMHELVHSFNKKKLETTSLYVEDRLTKTFDRIEWFLLYHALLANGFPLHFDKLLTEFYTTPTFAVLINGQSHGHIIPHRGTTTSITLLGEALSRIISLSRHVESQNM